MNRFRIAALVLVIGLAGTAAPAAAETRPVPLRAAAVAVVVTKNQKNGIFTYRYRVANPPVNRSEINGVEIDLTLAPDEARLGREGLVNARGYRRITSEANAAQVPMVPVGMSGPNGWLFGLGIDPAATHGYASWGSRDKPFRLSPGHELEGFGLTSYGLPGIRAVRLFVPIPYGDLPDAYSDPDEAGKLAESVTFHTRTLGPKAPPARVVPLEFLNYLITLLHESRAQGWVRTDGVHRSLLAKLLAAKRALEGGRAEAAAGELRAFVGEAAGAGCRELACPGSRPLTSEAYALLVFNGEHLLARLAEAGQGR